MWWSVQTGAHAQLKARWAINTPRQTILQSAVKQDFECQQQNDYRGDQNIRPLNHGDIIISLLLNKATYLLSSKNDIGIHWTCGKGKCSALFSVCKFRGMPK